MAIAAKLRAQRRREIRAAIVALAYPVTFCDGSACSWCGDPANARDEDGDACCAHCVSEDAGLRRKGELIDRASALAERRANLATKRA